MSKKFEMPTSTFVAVAGIHTAKSWNPGHGHDTTGTGNSGNKPGKPNKPGKK